MKKAIILLITISFLQLKAQVEKNKFLSEFLFEEKLSEENLNEKFKGFDFSNIILNNSDPGLGYMTKEKQRLDMIILSVIKNSQNNNYLIYGKTFINKIVSEFQGTISINNIQPLHYYPNRYLLTSKFLF